MLRRVLLALLLLGISTVASAQEGYFVRDNCVTEVSGPGLGSLCQQRTTASGFAAGALLRWNGSAWDLVAGGVQRVYPAAGCSGTTAGSVWDLPTASPAVAACITGANIQKGALDFADTAGGFSAQITELLRPNWTTTGGIDFTIHWFTSATTGNAKWTVQFVCTAVNAAATDDPAFPTTGSGFNTVTTAAPGTANRIQTSTITGATLPASCVSGNRMFLHIRLFRDGADAADTIGQTARFLFAELFYRLS